MLCKAASCFKQQLLHQNYGLTPVKITDTYHQNFSDKTLAFKLLHILNLY